MGAVRRPADERTVDEDRRDERDVVEVRAAGERIVDDDLVASGESFRTRKHCEHGPHRRRHRTEVNGDVLGLHELLPVRREQRRRAVGSLLDVGAERGAPQHRPHLVGDPLEPADEDGERGRVEGHAFSRGRPKLRQSGTSAASAARRSSARWWREGR